MSGCLLGDDTTPKQSMLQNVTSMLQDLVTQFCSEMLVIRTIWTLVLTKKGATTNIHQYLAAWICI